MPKWSALLPPGYRHLTMISSILGYKYLCHGATHAKMPIVNMWKSDVYHLLPMYHVYIKGRIKFLSPECLSTYLFKLPYNLPIYCKQLKLLKKITDLQWTLYFMSCIMSYDSRYGLWPSWLLIKCLGQGPKFIMGVPNTVFSYGFHGKILLNKT
jgi:hypothetical protein